jgi:hypothetical protein
MRHDDERLTVSPIRCELQILRGEEWAVLSAVLGRARSTGARP